MPHRFGNAIPEQRRQQRLHLIVCFHFGSKMFPDNPQIHAHKRGGGGGPPLGGVQLNCDSMLIFLSFQATQPKPLSIQDGDGGMRGAFRRPTAGGAAC